MTLPAPPPESKAGLVLASIGAVMQVGPFIGMFGTVIGMFHAFQSMGTSGTGDPSVLSKAIGETLVAIMAGIIASFVGVMLMLVGFVVFRCRRRWLVWVLISMGVFWLIAASASVFLMAAHAPPGS